MSTRTLTVEHGGITYTGELARIDSTSLGYEDHGILTAWLHCSWQGSGIGVGGYSLDAPPLERASGARRRPTAYGLDHLVQIMRTVGVDSWEKLPGQQVVVLFEGRGGIGSIAAGLAGVLNDRVLIFREHADTFDGVDR